MRLGAGTSHHLALDQIRLREGFVGLDVRSFNKPQGHAFQGQPSQKDQVHAVSGCAQQCARVSTPYRVSALAGLASAGM